MSNSVTVRVPARLHLGFLDPGGGTGRRFGSVGLPLSEPETVVTLSRAGQTTAEGSDSARAADHLATLCRRLGIRSHHRLVIGEAIPSHAGLGSGTQLALGVAAALRTLHQLPLDTDGDAILLSRGARSGIGIASFPDGGVIVDAGKDDSGGPPPIVARLAFPAEWRVILVLDHARQGLHGDAEMEAFRGLPPFPGSGAGEICRQVLMGILPGLAQADFHAFSAAVSAIQALVGEHFAPAQGGAFTSRRVEHVVRGLAVAGGAGIGQSSWGPTGFVFAPSPEAARQMVASVAALADDGIELRIVEGRNTGAKIISTGLNLVGS